MELGRSPQQPWLNSYLFYVSSIDETRGVSAKLHSPAGSPCYFEALLCLWQRHCPSLNLLVAWLPQQEYSHDLCCSVQWFSCIFCQLLHGTVQMGSEDGEWRGCGGCLGVRVHKVSQEVRAGTFPVGFIGFCGCWTLLFLQSCVQPGHPSSLGRVQTPSTYMSCGSSPLWNELFVCKKYSFHQLDPCCRFSCLSSPAGCCCSNL